MRTIKFRAWDKENKKLYKVTAIYSNNKCRVKDGATDRVCFNPILQQFTGLYDKNGVEIYEGDIVKSKGLTLSNSEIGIIEYNHYALRYKCFYTKEKNIYYDIYDLKISCSEINVIGNIYKNPELLEENK